MTPKHQAWKRLDFMHVFDDQNLSKKILETHNVKYHINSLHIGVKKNLIFQLYSQFYLCTNLFLK